MINNKKTTTKKKNAERSVTKSPTRLQPLHGMKAIQSHNLKYSVKSPNISSLFLLPAFKKKKKRILNKAFINYTLYLLLQVSVFRRIFKKSVRLITVSCGRFCLQLIFEYVFKKSLSLFQRKTNGALVLLKAYISEEQFSYE